MNIVFKTIHIQGFFSIGDVILDLDNQGFVLVKGENQNKTDNAKSNGSGKSSIFEAIIWALTGTTTRGTKDVVNKYTGTGTLVDLEFDIDEKQYQIIRTKDHEEYKTNLFVYVNNENISGKGIRDTEKILKEYLPDLDELILGSVIILGQSLPNRFTNNTPSGRKEILEKLSKSDFMIEDLKDRVSKIKKTLNNNLQNIRDKQIETQTKLNIQRKSLEEYEQKLQNIASAQFYEDAIKDFEAKLFELTNDKGILTEELDNLKLKLKQKIDDKSKLSLQSNTILSSIENKYKDELDATKVKLMSFDFDLKNKRAELKKLQSIKDVCPTCGQKLHNIEKPDTSSLEDEINILQEQQVKLDADYKNLLTEKEQEEKISSKEIQEKMDDLSDEIVSLETQINKKDKESETLKNNIYEAEKCLNGAKYNLSVLESSRETLTNQIDDCNKLIDEFSNILVNLNKEKEEINNRLDIQSKFDVILKRDFRGFLLSNIIEYIDKKAKEYCQVIFDNTFIEFKLEGNNISICYKDREYEVLSGGEKQKIDLIIQFSIRQMLCEYLNFNCSLLVLDEIFDNLDIVGCEKVISMISSNLVDINSIYIISHHADELNIPADNCLMIIKDNNGVSHIKV